MPEETQAAVAWARQQTNEVGDPITVDDHGSMVDKVREYFNANSIPYETFSYADLEPYLR